MATERFICKKCDCVVDIDTRRKNKTCPYCSADLSWHRMRYNTVVKNKMYRGDYGTSEKKVKIPADTKEIENGAFQGSYSIEEISFPKSLQEIPANCFKQCSSLRKIVIPGNIKRIGSSAFEGCYTLEEVILSEGVEEIGWHCFERCNKLKKISLPKSLKTINSDAFNMHIFDFKYISLPPKIEYIGMDAFGPSFKQDKILWSVSEGTYGEEYLKKKELTYQTINNDSGLILSENIVDNTLYYYPEHNNIVVVSDGVEKIAEGAFSNHEEIKEIIFPESLRVIEANAFSKCTGITKIKFNDQLKEIGSKAFYDVCLPIVDLPKSIEKLEFDAFKKNCFISIGDEMPFYESKCAAINEKKAIVDQKEQAKSQLIEKQKTLTIQLDDLKKAPPTEIENIPYYQNLIDELAKKLTEKKDETSSKIESLSSQKQERENKITRLTNEKKSTFFLSFSKKKEISAAIEVAQNEILAIDDEKAKALDELLAFKNDITKKQDQAKNSLSALQAMKSDWKTKIDFSLNDLNLLEKEEKKLTSEIEEAKEDFEKSKVELTLEHKEWKREREKALNSLKTRELNDKKKSLISSLKLPVYKNIPVFKFSPRDAIIEEELLNDAYLGSVENINKRNAALTHNKYINSKKNIINEIIELNLSLGCDEYDRIEKYKIVDIPRDKYIELPKRFKNLNAHFSTFDEWIELKNSHKMIVTPKENEFFDKFFADSDFLSFSDGARFLYLFPYCIAVCNQKQQIKVVTYDKVTIRLEQTMHETESGDIPAHGEFIKERHKYLNADGSVSKRYKVNPLVKIYRLTSIVFNFGDDSISFPTNTYREALMLEDAFGGFLQSFETESKMALYKFIISSADLDTIEEAIVLQEKLIKEQEAIEKERIAIEARRSEEEKLAKQKADAEKKKAIIQRQKEINAERKRQEKQKEEEARRIAKLFDDSFEDNKDEIATQSAPKVAMAFEVEGKRLISNTVFKVALRLIDDSFDAEAVSYFTDNSGEIISNKKKISFTSDSKSLSVGFILNSGIDYTAMKKCYMYFEVQGELIGQIEFDSNISFYSDF